MCLCRGPMKGHHYIIKVNFHHTGKISLLPANAYTIGYQAGLLIADLPRICYHLLKVFPDSRSPPVRSTRILPDSRPARRRRFIPSVFTSWGPLVDDIFQITAKLVPDNDDVVSLNHDIHKTRIMRILFAFAISISHLMGIINNYSLCDPCSIPSNRPSTIRLSFSSILMNYFPVY